MEENEKFKVLTRNHMDNIYNQDAREGIPTLTTNVHLTITSPPYYNVKEYVSYASYEEYLETLRDVFRKILAITHPGRMCCVNLSNILVPRVSRNNESQRIPLAFHFVSLMEGIGWKFIEDILWVKPEGASKNRNGGFFQHRQPLAYKPNTINEYIFVFQKRHDKLIDSIVRSYDAQTAEASKVDIGYERTNVWFINPETKSKHPAPYPVELVEKLIRYYSYVGDVVLDPFIGSGTTAVAAKMLGRHYIGFEIHDEYIQLAKERLEKVVPVKVSELKLPEVEDEGTLRQWLKKQQKRTLHALSNCTTKSVSKNDLISRIAESWTLSR